MTGMHLDKKYGHTIDEIYKSNIENIVQYMNFTLQINGSSSVQ